jgi:hypothetical protein
MRRERWAFGIEGQLVGLFYAQGIQPFLKHSDIVVNKYEREPLWAQHFGLLLDRNAWRDGWFTKVKYRRRQYRTRGA